MTFLEQVLVHVIQAIAHSSTWWDTEEVFHFLASALTKLRAKLTAGMTSKLDDKTPIPTASSLHTLV